MIGTPNRRVAKLSEHGFVLVAVLWILAALSALAVVFAVYLSNSAQALAINDTAIEAEGVISAGVELTAYQLLLTKDDERPSRGSFHTRLNGADLAVSYVSEAARVDLNAAPKELLTGLLTTLGADGDNASNYADRIVGWRTAPASGAAGNPPSDAAAGNEDALYRAAGLPYSPRQAPFAHASELALVLDLPPALVERALPLVTVYSGSSGVDVLIAEPDVIAALPGMTPLVLKDFLNTRATLPNDPAAIAEALGPAQAGAAKQKSKAYRLLVKVKLRNGRERVSEVVISVSAPNQQSQQGNGQNGQGQQAGQNGQAQPVNGQSQQDEQEVVPYHVLSWQDDVVLTRRPPKREEL
jgi:general secretion pathway protein K